MSCERFGLRAILGLALCFLATQLVWAQSNTEILFRADMSVQIDQGNFDPATQTVFVRGELNEWNCPTLDPDTELFPSVDDAQIYERVVQIDGLLPDTYAHKYHINDFSCSGGGVWEDDPNHTYTVDGSEPDSDENGYGELTVERFFNDVSGLPDVEVLFQADMSVQIARGNFDPGTQSVFVRGDLNGWNCPTTDPDTQMFPSSANPEIYEVLVPLSGVATGTYNYKLHINNDTCSDGGVWEGDPNKTYTVDGTEPDSDGNGFGEISVLRYFDDLEPTVEQSTELLIQCDMSVQIEIGNFVPGTDTIIVSGEFNSFACLEMTPSAANEEIYEATAQIADLPLGEYRYKFRINCNNDNYESGDDRTYTVDGTEMDTDANGFAEVHLSRFFNDISEAPYSTEVLFQADMSVQFELGNFDPDSGQVHVRGAINDWGCTAMSPSVTDPLLYEVTIQTTELSSGSHPYKFNIGCADGGWESEGNREFTIDNTLTDTDGNGFVETSVRRFFNDLSSEDVILDDVVVVFAVDVSAARLALDSGAELQSPQGTITKWTDVQTVGVTGPFLDWNWNDFNSTNFLNDDGNGFDSTFGDSVYTGEVVIKAGSSREQLYKYGLNGFDLEAGFEQNRSFTISAEDEAAGQLVLAPSCFGSQNTDDNLPLGSVEGGFSCGSGLRKQGDCNGDGKLDIADPVCGLNSLFGGSEAFPCGEDAEDGNKTVLDPNGDKRVDISDNVYMLNWLFSSGLPPVLGTDCILISGCDTACSD